MTNAGPLPKITNTKALDELMAKQDAKKTLPAIFFCATNADETIYLNQAGDRVFGQPDKGQVTEDTPVEIFSQTKLLTSTAMLQLVEAGKADLDDPAFIEKHLPELSSLKLLTGYDDKDDAILVPPKGKITLRNLLTHTSGLCYAFLETPATKYFEKTGMPAQFKGTMDVLLTPLIFEPNTTFFYSHATDFVGILVERITGGTLEEYFQKNFFQPLGMSTMTFLPTQKVHDTKMAVCTRYPPGDPNSPIVVIPGNFGMSRPTTPEDVKVQLGGAGLFGSQKDYLAFLRAVLRSNPALGRSDAFLTPYVYNALFTPALPEAPHPHREHIALFYSMWMPDGDRAYTAKEVSHSLGCGLVTADQEGRRRAGSAWWGGVAKSTYWIDPTAGVAAIVGTNLLIQGVRTPDEWQPFLYEFERTLYKSLE